MLSLCKVSLAEVVAPRTEWEWGGRLKPPWQLL